MVQTAGCPASAHSRPAVEGQTPPLLHGECWCLSPDRRWHTPAIKKPLMHRQECPYQAMHRQGTCIHRHNARRDMRAAMESESSAAFQEGRLCSRWHSPSNMRGPACSWKCRHIPAHRLRLRHRPLAPPGHPWASTWPCADPGFHICRCIQPCCCTRQWPVARDH